MSSSTILMSAGSEVYVEGAGARDEEEWYSRPRPKRRQPRSRQGIEIGGACWRELDRLPSVVAGLVELAATASQAPRSFLTSS